MIHLQLLVKKSPLIPECIRKTLKILDFGSSVSQEANTIWTDLTEGTPNLEKVALMCCNHDLFERSLQGICCRNVNEFKPWAPVGENVIECIEKALKGDCLPKVESISVEEIGPSKYDDAMIEINQGCCEILGVSLKPSSLYDRANKAHFPTRNEAILIRDSIMRNHELTLLLFVDNDC